VTEQEFKTLVRRLSPRLLRVAGPLTETRLDAEEVVQDVWLAVWNAKGDCSPDQISDSWVYGVTINIANSKTRRVTRRRRIVDQRPPMAKKVATQPPLEATLLIEQVWREIAELPDMQREVLLARLIDGKSVGEAAHSLGRANGTIKAHLHHALSKLKNKFGRTLEDALGSASTSRAPTEADHD